MIAAKAKERVQTALSDEAFEAFLVKLAGLANRQSSPVRFFTWHVNHYHAEVRTGAAKEGPYLPESWSRLRAWSARGKIELEENKAGGRKRWRVASSEW